MWTGSDALATWGPVLNQRQLPVAHDLIRENAGKYSRTGRGTRAARRGGCCRPACPGNSGRAAPGAPRGSPVCKKRTSRCTEWRRLFPQRRLCSERAAHGRGRVPRPRWCSAPRGAGAAAQPRGLSLRIRCVFPRGQLCPAHRESHRVLARQLAFDRVRSALPQSVAPDHTAYCKLTV